MAMAVVGGIHELVLQAIEQERLVAALPELADLTGRLVRAAVQGESAGAPAPKPERRVGQGLLAGGSSRTAASIFSTCLSGFRLR